MEANKHDDAADGNVAQKNNQQPQKDPGGVQKKLHKRRLIFRSSVAVLLFGVAQYFNNPIHKFICVFISLSFAALALRIELRNHTATNRNASASAIVVFLLVFLVAGYAILLDTKQVNPSESQANPDVRLVLHSIESNIFNLSLTNSYLLFVPPASGGALIHLNEIKGCLIIPFDPGRKNCRLNFGVENDSGSAINELRILAILPWDVSVNVFTESTETIIPQNVPEIDRVLTAQKVATNIIPNGKALAIDRLSPLWPNRHSEFGLEFLEVEGRDTRRPVLIQLRLMSDANKPKRLLFWVAFCDTSKAVYKYLNSKYPVGEPRPFVVETDDFNKQYEKAMINPNEPSK